MNRGISINQAADMCGITVSNYRKWVNKGIVPGPWPGTQRYDRKAINVALDKLSGINEQSPETAYEEWKLKRNNDN